jgi:hypothetical protein
VTHNPKFDPLLAALDARLAALEAQKPRPREEVVAELIAKIAKYKADRAAGIPLEPGPPDTPLSPAEEAEIAEVHEAIAAYKRRREEATLPASASVSSTRTSIPIPRAPAAMVVPETATAEPWDRARPRRGPPEKAFDPTAPNEPGPAGQWGDPKDVAVPAPSPEAVQLHGPELAAAQMRNARGPDESPGAFAERVRRGRQAAKAAERWAEKMRPPNPDESSGWMG